MLVNEAPEGTWSAVITAVFSCQPKLPAQNLPQANCEPKKLSGADAVGRSMDATFDQDDEVPPFTASTR